MQASYGYTDGTGEYYITIDTDQCDGCAKCVGVCPESIYEVAADDYGKIVARVRDNVVHKISYICPGDAACAKGLPENCRTVCGNGAFSFTW